MSRTPTPPAARLMLVLTLTPDLSVEAVEAAVRAGDVAAVVLRLAPDGASLASRLRAVAAAIQGQGAAALVDGPAELVAAAGLDGVHAAAEGAGAPLQAAIKALKPDAIVGAGALTSRHDAMVAGESGADYVFFGPLVPEEGVFARTCDLVAWWAELFEVPCVGLAASLDEVEALAGAGADFVALAESLVRADGARAVAAAQARLAAQDGAS